MWCEECYVRGEWWVFWECGGGSTTLELRAGMASGTSWCLVWVWKDKLELVRHRQPGHHRYTLRIWEMTRGAGWLSDGTRDCKGRQEQNHKGLHILRRRRSAFSWKPWKDFVGYKGNSAGWLMPRFLTKCLLPNPYNLWMCYLTWKKGT